MLLKAKLLVSEIIISVPFLIIMIIFSHVMIKV